MSGEMKLYPKPCRYPYRPIVKKRKTWTCGPMSKITVTVVGTTTLRTAIEIGDHVEFWW